MKSKIRRIGEEDNILFELIHYKVSLDFLVESQNRELNEKYKKIILSEFRNISCEVDKKQNKFYLQYKLKSQDNWLPNCSLSLSNEVNIVIKLLILNENEDKQKYITSYLNELANSKNQSLIPYTRLFILNNKHYENYLQRIKNKLPIDKSEAGVIYCPLKESGFKYIYKFTLIQIIQAINDYGKKQYEIGKHKDQNRSSKEIIFKKIEESILYHDFRNALNLCSYLENSVNWLSELSSIREIVGLISFYQDYYSTPNHNDFSFRYEIKELLEELADLYRKKKDYCRECECLLRLSIYYSYFIGSESKCEKIIQRILIASQNTPYEFQIFLMLQIIWLYQQRNNIRKQNFNNYIGITICQKNNEEIKNTLNLFINFLNSHFPIYDIYHKKIENLEIFNNIHRKVIKKGWKNLLFQMEEKDNNGQMVLKEVSKKKIVKGSKIFISNYNKDINQFKYNLIWFNIQECLFRNIINYCKNNHEMLFVLIYYMSYLQSLEKDLNENKQYEIVNEITNDSFLNINKKINLSLYKVPILIKITPICSNIKFDISKNEKLPKKKQLFLYNPWKKSSTINYFWSKNSYQYITIEFQNILKIPITLNNIIILFERKKIEKENNQKENDSKEKDTEKDKEKEKDKENDSKDKDKNKENDTKEIDENFNKGRLPICFPTSVTIPPNEKATVIEKIKMVDEVIFDIIGIKYDVFNFTTEQYIDANGNGLYYCCENLLKDNYYSTVSTGKKKIFVNLKGIQVYKEIPQLEIINLNSISTYDNNNNNNYIPSDTVMNLYEYQEYIFPFEFKNNGNYPIDEITYFVYNYKKEDYKICLFENTVKNKIDIGETYKIEYKYIHKRTNYKIEFRFYLKSNKKDIENENEEEIIKPYIFYFKRINTENLLNFDNPKIIPEVNNNSIEEICKRDNRLPFNYNYVYSYNKQIFSFSASNSRKNKISLLIKDENNILKQESINDEYSKEISFDININTKLSNVNIFWECANGIMNVKGNMNIYDIFPILKNNLKEENYFQFSLDVKKNNDQGCGDEMNIFDITYSVKNTSDKKFNDLKLFCYVYQNINESEFSLNDELFYEGSLISSKNVLEPNESLMNRIILYLEKKYLNYATTFLLINPENKTVYMSPINKELK